MLTIAVLVEIDVTSPLFLYLGNEHLIKKGIVKLLLMTFFRPPSHLIASLGLIWQPRMTAVCVQFNKKGAHY